MLDQESKIVALIENYGVVLLLEQNDVSEYVVVKFLVDEGLIDLDDYFNFDAELEEWEKNEND
jgi:hypothetical protein